MCFCNNMLETQSCNIPPSVSINMVRMQNILIVKVIICIWTLIASVAEWREEQPWSSYCLSREPEPFTKDIPSCEWIDVIFNRVRLSLSGSMSDRWVTRRGEKNTAIFSFIYKSPANVGDMRYYLSVRFLERVFALCERDGNSYSTKNRLIRNRYQTHIIDVSVSLSVSLSQQKLRIKAVWYTRLEQLISELLINHTNITQTVISHSWICALGVEMSS